MADQAMYHQGNQSVFVGGRLWTLLPPPAVEMDWKFFIYSDVSHTHTPRQAGIFSEECEAEQNVRNKSGCGSLYTYGSGGSAQFSKGERKVKKSVLR